MVETSAHGKMNIHPHLHNAIQFRLDKTNEINRFIAETNKRETMSKTLVNYVGKASLVLSAGVVVLLLIYLLLLLVRVLELLV